MASPQPLESATQARINDVLQKYKTAFQVELGKRQLNPWAFFLFRPHNLVQAVDRSRVHFVFHFDRATDGMVIARSADLTEFGDIQGQALLEQLRHEMGFKEATHLAFPREYLQLPEDELDKRLSVDARRNLEEELKQVVRQTQSLLPEVDQALPDFMRRASEDEFIESVFIPLLHQMGFRKAKAKGHEDKDLEYGNDIREMKLQLPTGHHIYFAAQVKAGDIIYGIAKPSQNVERLLTEARMAFEKAFVDPEINRDVRADHVFVVASGAINEGARNYLLERISEEKRRNLLFLDRDDIIGLARRFGLPEAKQRAIMNKGKS